jgi:DNA-binding NarL/FixJ family response regulator
VPGLTERDEKDIHSNIICSYLKAYTHSPALQNLDELIEESRHVLRIAAGAHGFPVKDTAPAELVRAVVSVVAGDAMLSPSVARRVMKLAPENTSERMSEKPQSRDAPARVNGLTERLYD